MRRAMLLLTMMLMAGCGPQDQMDETGVGPPLPEHLPVEGEGSSLPEGKPLPPEGKPLPPEDTMISQPY
jgi:hypothetical protein